MSQPDILPNSRTKRAGKVILGGSGQHRLNWVPIYCANCGAEGGFVPEEHCNFAFWLCNNCFETHGKIAGTMAMPDEVFWEKVAQNKEPKEI